MISFVVQNFFNTPFLYKTQRYNNLVISMNTKLLYTFIKLNSHYAVSCSQTIKSLTFTMFMYRKFFTKTFFNFFKNIYSKQMGIMSLNLTKSFIYKTFSDLNYALSSNNFKNINSRHIYSNHNIKYLQPVTVVSFSFHKKTYDTLMIFILLLLVSNYTPSQNSFRLYYSYILKSPNFTLYPFLNLFYFKLKQF